MFEFYVGTRVTYGKGCRSALQKIVSDNGWGHVGVVIDRQFSETEASKELITGLERTCKCTVALCGVSEPTYDFLEVIRKDFEGRDIEAVVGIGGGSALDAAKAVAVLARNLKPAIEYRGFNRMTEPVLPIIAVPTTAGTGSEVTPNASFVDAAEKRKMGINGEAVRPRYALLDPELTLSCPQAPTISAAVDSMVHAVEAFAAKKSNPMARMFAKEGFRLVFHNLPLAVKEPQSVDFREGVMHGAFLSGIALMNSGTGPAAAMSYPLGVHYKVPHGIGGGIFLPHVIRHNVENGYYDYSGLLNGIVSDAAAGKYAAMKFVETIFELWEALSIPSDLTRFGLEGTGIPAFVKETMDLKGALDQNPLPFYEREIEKTLNLLGVR